VFRALVLLVCAATLVTPACGGRSSNLSISDVLFVPSTADILPDAATPIATENGRSLFVDGSASVSFRLLGERESLSSRIVDHFARLGWRVRSVQYLNPTIPTSFAEGWSRRESGVLLLDSQGRVVVPEVLYLWHGEWEDSDGNVVVYNLSAQGQELRGYASRVPRGLVQASRR
jgi:hypothetical protein